MGLILMAGVGLDIFGFGWLVVSIILLVSSLKKKKTSMYILTGLSFILGLAILALGIYFTLGPFYYAGMI